MADRKPYATQATQATNPSPQSRLSHKPPEKAAPRASEWREMTLEDLTENYDGQRIPVKEAERKPGAYPYYGASGIVDYVDKYIFDGEYLLIAEDGENLRTQKTPIAFLARGKFWVNNHAHIVTGNSKADTRFLMYALNNGDISGFLTGSTMPKLTQGNMNRIPILAPPLPEQRAIASVLGALDDKIELNRRMNETLEALAQTLFKSWFVAATQSALPKGWREGTLADITGFLGGYAFKSKDWIEQGVPVVKIGSVKPGIVDLNEVSFVSVEVAAEAKRYRLCAGDLLIGMTGYVGEVGLVPPSDNPPLLNQRVGKFVLEKPGTAGLGFLYCLCRRPEFKAAVEVKSHGTAQANVSADGILSVPVTVPPQTLVEKFNDFCEPVLNRILANHAESRTLAALRDALLPKLLSGELRVPAAKGLAETVST